MNEVVNVDEEAIESLRDALQTAGEEYKYNLNRLITLINDITNEEIKGTPATNLLKYFKSKEENFKKIEETINRAEENINRQRKEYNNMVMEMEEEMEAK